MGVIILLIIVICILSYLSRQLYWIHYNLPDVVKKREEIGRLVQEDLDGKLIEVCEKRQVSSKDRGDEFLKELDYSSGVYMEGTLSSVQFKTRNMPNHKGIKNTPEQEIHAFFNGVAEGHFGGLSDKEQICEASCEIHFIHKNIEGSKLYDNLDSIPVYHPQKSSGSIVLTNQYDGEDIVKDLHIMWFSIYEDIQEYKKFEALITSGKKISIRVFGRIWKENKWKEPHGWVTDYSISIGE